MESKWVDYSLTGPVNAASGTGANHCHLDRRADRSIGKKERQRDERWGGKDGEAESMQRRALAWPVPEALLHTPWPLYSVGLLHLFLKANTAF